MAKRVPMLFSIFLVICLLFSSVSVVTAAPLGDGPVVTPLTGSGKFTTSVISFEDLPGSVRGTKGGLFPASDPGGSKQFSGDGVQVQGLVGSARVCFPMKSTRYGWQGTIYQWDGSAWNKLETTTTEIKESQNAQACAVIYGDGTYALIVGYKTPENQTKVIQECSAIQFASPIFNWAEAPATMYINGVRFFPGVALNTRVSYAVIDIQPEGAVTGNLRGSGLVTNNIMIDPSIPLFYSEALISESPALYFDDSVINPYWPFSASFTIRFYIGGCYKDFHWPTDLS